MNTYIYVIDLVDDDPYRNGIMAYHKTLKGARLRVKELVECGFSEKKYLFIKKVKLND